MVPGVSAASAPSNPIPSSTPSPEHTAAQQYAASFDTVEGPGVEFDVDQQRIPDGQLRTNARFDVVRVFRVSRSFQDLHLRYCYTVQTCVGAPVVPQAVFTRADVEMLWPKLVHPAAAADKSA